MRILAIIPARGGSKGIPRKNVRLINNKPLISYPIQAALGSKIISDVVVSTESQEIAHISSLYGAKIVDRPENLAQDEITLDPVIYHTVESLEYELDIKYDYVVTIQATSPLITTNTIDAIIKKAIKLDVDNIISVVDDRHLTWTIENGITKPNYVKRVNRQQLPINYKETGGVLLAKRSCVTRNTRLGTNIGLYEVPYKESIDIDTESDWWIAEKLLARKKILIRVDGDSIIGMGHIYRTLLLAYRLIDHDILFLTDKAKDAGYKKLIESNFNVKTFANDSILWEIIDNYKPDLIINDILDTSSDYVKKLKDRSIFVASFEDLGEGAMISDVVINALYDEKYQMHNHYWGKDFYCLKEEFQIVKPKVISEVVEKVLITFGGTDPNDYTKRIVGLLSTINCTCQVDVILGLGYQKKEKLKEYIQELGLKVNILHNVSSMSEYMSKADLIFTSAGRTVYECASLGVPTIVLAQNNRELHHTFASPKNGIVNLMLGTSVSDEEIINTFNELAGSYELRLNNSNLMLSSNLKDGIKNVLGVIFNSFENNKE